MFGKRKLTKEQLLRKESNNRTLNAIAATIVLSIAYPTLAIVGFIWLSSIWAPLGWIFALIIILMMYSGIKGFREG